MNNFDEELLYPDDDRDSGQEADMYEVKFEGDLFELTVVVGSFSKDHNDIVDQAVDLMESELGWDLQAIDKIYEVSRVARME